MTTQDYARIYSGLTVLSSITRHRKVRRSHQGRPGSHAAYHAARHLKRFLENPGNLILSSTAREARAAAAQLLSQRQPRAACAAGL